MDYRAFLLPLRVSPLFDIMGKATLPNYKGMFLRGQGSQNHLQWNGGIIGNTWTTHSSGNLGAVQGDASRNVWAKAIPYSYHWGYSSAANMLEFKDSADAGAFYRLTAEAGGAHQEHHQWNGNVKGLGMDGSRVVPTANENRPANVAVNYIIKAY